MNDWPRLRFAVIPSNGRACLKDCLMAIQPQVDYVMLVMTAPHTEGELRPEYGHGVLIRDLRSPNISRWWNQGFDFAERAVNSWAIPPTVWDVAVLNDDVIVPPDWFTAVSDKMRDMKAAAACSGSPYGSPVFHTHAGPVPLDTRMQGFAFIVAGEKKMRANEELRWYWSDDYMDWEARRAGGMVMIPGYQVTHLYPNGQMTGELHQFSAEDAGKFVAIYGQRPW